MFGACLYISQIQKVPLLVVAILLVCVALLVRDLLVLFLQEPPLPISQSSSHEQIDISDLSVLYCLPLFNAVA